MFLAVKTNLDSSSMLAVNLILIIMLKHLLRKIKTFLLYFVLG